MTKKLKLKGTQCKHCNSIIKSTLESIDGVRVHNLMHKDRKISIEYNEQEIDDELIRNLIRDEGYEVSKHGAGIHRGPKIRLQCMAYH